MPFHTAVGELEQSDARPLSSPPDGKRPKHPSVFPDSVDISSSFAIGLSVCVLAALHPPRPPRVQSIPLAAAAALPLFIAALRTKRLVSEGSFQGSCLASLTSSIRKTSGLALRLDVPSTNAHAASSLPHHVRGLAQVSIDSRCSTISGISPSPSPSSIYTSTSVLLPIVSLCKGRRLLRSY